VAQGFIGTKSDVDYFSFTASGATTVSLSGLERVANLDAELLLYNAAGTVLGSSDPGDSIFASLSQTLASGTYYAAVRSDGEEGEIGQYTLNVSTAAVSTTPGTPNLAAGSDSGFSADDDVTNRDNSSDAKRLQFTVSGTVSGATVTLYADGVAVGTAAASGTTTTVTTNGTLDIADGLRAFSARQTEPGKSQSAASAALTVTIDTAAPTADVVDVSPDPRTTAVDSVAVVFSEAVQQFDVTDLSLTREGAAVTLGAAQAPTSADGVTFTVPNLGTLTGQWGNYVLSVIPAATGTIVDRAGNAFAAAASDAWLHSGAAPTVTGLTDSPDPVIVGATLTLTATGVNDADAGQALAVAFYRENQRNGRPAGGLRPAARQRRDLALCRERRRPRGGRHVHALRPGHRLARPDQRRRLRVHHGAGRQRHPRRARPPRRRRHRLVVERQRHPLRQQRHGRAAAVRGARHRPRCDRHAPRERRGDRHRHRRGRDHRRDDQRLRRPARRRPRGRRTPD
jgi:hypothetical protein